MTEIKTSETSKKVEVETISTRNRISFDDEISIIDIFYLFWEKRKLVYITSAVFLIVGILIAATSPVEYQAKSRKLLDGSGSGSEASIGAISGLAGLAGLSIPTQTNSGSALGPSMYPEIVSSQPFLLDLMQEKFHFQEIGKALSLFEYFNREKRTHMFKGVFNFLKSIPGRFFALLDKNKEWDLSQVGAQVPDIGNVISEDSVKIETNANVVYQLSGAQMNAMAELTSRIMIETEEGIITLSVTMPEPYVGAQLNNIVFDKIIEYATAYKTDKERQNLEFIEERCLEAESQFKKSQINLATFRDSNRGIIAELAKTQEELLVAEFNMNFDIYKSLAQQREKAKFELKKTTPLFSEFEPVTIPHGKSEPNIPKIMLIHLVLGIAMGGLLIFAVLVNTYRREIFKRN